MRIESDIDIFQPWIGWYRENRSLSGVSIEVDSILTGRQAGLPQYEADFTNAPNTITRVATDIVHAGQLQAACFIAGLQSTLARKDDAAVIFATGKTQWFGLWAAKEYLDQWGNWEARDQQILRGCGVDLDERPDMSRLKAFHLDTIFPQRRTARYSYANELGHMFDHLNIPTENRTFFYGDVSPSGGQLSDLEFAALLKSTREEGLLLEEFQNGSLLTSHTQHDYLAAMTESANEISRKLVERGGADIQFYSTGNAYNGDGHVGFNEAGTAFNTPARLLYLSHHALAGNIKANGGLDTNIARNGRQRFGGATLGPHELRLNPDVVNIGIITNNQKAKSAAAAREMESTPLFQVTGMQNGGPGSVHIFDFGSARELACFKKFRDMKRDTIAEPLTPRLALAELGLQADDTVLHIGPHLDDLSLACQFFISEWGKPGNQRIVSHYTCEGYTAVADPYALHAVHRVTEFTDEQIADMVADALSDFEATEEALLRELVEHLETATPNLDPTCYNYWPDMKPEEQELRAKLLVLRLIHQCDLHAISPLGQEQFKDLFNLLQTYQQAKQEWEGTPDIQIMKEIKTILRFAEEQTELIGRGTAYADVCYPWKSSWYGTVDRESTVAQEDIDRVKDRIRELQPRLLVTNGEGFMDHEAHCITEMTVRMAVSQMLQDNEIDWPLSILFYQGVWDRTEVTGAIGQLLVVVDDATLDDNGTSFGVNYRSQAPNNLQDPSTYGPKLFSDSVRVNAEATKAEYERRSGKKREEAGILAFNCILNVNANPARDMFVEHSLKMNEELERVAEPIKNSSLSNILGSQAKLADLYDFDVTDGQKVFMSKSEIQATAA